jgi:hypothetical protein
MLKLIANSCDPCDNLLKEGASCQQIYPIPVNMVPNDMKTLPSVYER